MPGCSSCCSAGLSSDLPPTASSTSSGWSETHFSQGLASRTGVLLLFTAINSPSHGTQTPHLLLKGKRGARQMGFLLGLSKPYQRNCLSSDCNSFSFRTKMTLAKIQGISGLIPPTDHLKEAKQWQDLLLQGNHHWEVHSQRGNCSAEGGICPKCCSRRTCALPMDSVPSL